MPVTSALNICIPPDELSIGMTASVNRIIPMPPIHCISERQTKMPWLMPEMSVRTDAPVVVKALMESKKASVKLSPGDPIMNGINPNSENITHTSDVSRNPSRFPISEKRGLIR